MRSNMRILSPEFVDARANLSLMQRANIPIKTVTAKEASRIFSLKEKHIRQNEMQLKQILQQRRLHNTRKANEVVLSNRASPRILPEIAKSLNVVRT